MVKYIPIFILIIILIISVYHFFFNNPSLSSAKVNLKGHTYTLEIAKTVPQQTKGLMDRSSLCRNCGMIFVFGLDLPQVFWMKDTLIPLDMIFADHTGLIVNTITANPQPGVPDSQLKLYQSLKPAKFVIELNAGDANKLSLKPGDTIDLSQF